MRNEAFFTISKSFLPRLAAAPAAALPVALLGPLGHRPPVDGSIQPQTERIIAFCKIITIYFPAALSLVSLVLKTRYPLRTKEQMQMVKDGIRLHRLTARGALDPSAAKAAARTGDGSGAPEGAPEAASAAGAATAAAGQRAERYSLEWDSDDDEEGTERPSAAAVAAGSTAAAAAAASSLAAQRRSLSRGSRDRAASGDPVEAGPDYGAAAARGVAEGAATSSSWGSTARPSTPKARPPPPLEDEGGITHTALWLRSFCRCFTVLKFSRLIRLVAGSCGSRAARVPLPAPPRRHRGRRWLGGCCVGGRGGTRRESRHAPGECEA